jgi:hypothetical protein
VAVLGLRGAKARDIDSVVGGSGRSKDYNGLVCLKKGETAHSLCQGVTSRIHRWDLDSLQKIRRCLACFGLCELVGERKKELYKVYSLFCDK